MGIDGLMTIPKYGDIHLTNLGLYDKYIEINIGTTILYHWQLVACDQQSKRRLHELIWCARC